MAQLVPIPILSDNVRNVQKIKFAQAVVTITLPYVHLARSPFRKELMAHAQHALKAQCTALLIHAVLLAKFVKTISD